MGSVYSWIKLLKQGSGVSGKFRFYHNNPGDKTVCFDFDAKNREITY